MHIYACLSLDNDTSSTAAVDDIDIESGGNPSEHPSSNHAQPKYFLTAEFVVLSATRPLLPPNAGNPKQTGTVSFCMATVS